MSARFERAVVQTGIFNDVAGPVAIKLLQREHAAVVRQIRSLQRVGVDMRNLAGMEAHAYKLACIDLLTWLNERGR